MGISNGYEKQERCESGWCRFKVVHHAISAVAVFIFFVYGGLAFVSMVIFKESIYLRLRYCHESVWQEIESPKFCALMENFYLLEALSESKARMEAIAHMDQLLFKLINLTINLNDVVNKAT